MPGDARLVVIDASIAVKWQLRDEDGTEYADRVFDDYSLGLVLLIAPDLWLPEVVNGVRNAVLRRRLSREQGLIAAEILNRVAPSLYPFSSVALRSYDLACDHGLAVYDAAYLALAEQLHADLYTADRPFFDRVRSSFPRARWFAEYPGA